MEHTSKWYSEDEFAVAEILVELRRCKRPLLNWDWSGKRKRSALKHRLPFPPTPLRDAVLSSPPSSPTDTLTPVKVKASSSPATPLSFSPTESDDKPKSLPRKKPSLKRRKEQYLKVIEELTQRKAALTEEFDKVKRYHEKLNVFNSELKARLEGLNDLGKKKGKNGANSECGGSMQSLHGVNASVNASNGMAENENKPQLQLPNAAQQESEGQSERGTTSSAMMETSSSIPSSGALLLGHVNNNRGPIPNLDLNLSPEELASQPLDEVVGNNKDLIRALAAQARLRRLVINRNKHQFRNNKPFCSSNK